MNADTMTDTFLADVADVLHRTHTSAPVDVALGLARCGVLVLPTVPGDRREWFREFPRKRAANHAKS